jgi:hypothetical protein
MGVGVARRGLWVKGGRRDTPWRIQRRSDRVPMALCGTGHGTLVLDEVQQSSRRTGKRPTPARRADGFARQAAAQLQRLSPRDSRGVSRPITGYMLESY